MITKELIKYIEEKISSGINKEEVEKELLSNGWDNNDINEAFSKIPKKISKYNITFSNDYLVNIIFFIIILLPLIVQITPLLNIPFYIVTPFFLILLPILILYFFISSIFHSIFPFFYSGGNDTIETYHLDSYSGFFYFTILWIIFWYLIFFLFSKKENPKKIFLSVLITSIPFYILGTLLLIYLDAFK